MTYDEVLKNARTKTGPYCKACTICNGIACRNTIPGPGAKGTGDTAIRNYEKWQDIRINMDTISTHKTAKTELSLFGKTFTYPFFAAPVGALNMHYGDTYTDMEYNEVLVSTCRNNGIAAFTGDGLNQKVIEAATAAIARADGIGIPTIKPWNLTIIKEKIDYVKKAAPFAIAMDIDAAGLPFLKNMTPPAGLKSVDDLKTIADYAAVPFIIKGIMTVQGALKALEAGAAGIVVSNHGGRVLDQCPATAEVLADIASAVGKKMKVFVDGGIRSGTDVFKALALGADAVLIGRPFVTATYGGGQEGIKLYIEKIAGELADTMMMCGAFSLNEISRDMIRI
jgi:4-hydroxymandelate oxidase